MYQEYLTAAAAARRDELLQAARSRYRARERGRRHARQRLLLRVRRLSAERDGAMPVFGRRGGQMAGSE